jgi:hypothetical protein
MGRFLSDLVVRVLNDSGPRPWLEVESPFGYRCDDGEEIVVRERFQFDGASIPPAGMGVIGWPGLRAACLHDWLLEQPSVPRERADDVFREALAACGVPDVTAHIMWTAVALRTSRIARYGDDERVGA